MTPDDVRIRPATPADRAALDRLQSALDSPWPDLLALAVRGPGPPCLVADRGGRVVGYLLALDGRTPEPASDRDDATAQVVELVVARGDRRQGIGSALLDTFADRCAADRLWLTVRAADAAARAFYAAQGFEPTDRRPDYYEIDGESLDALVLERPL